MKVHINNPQFLLAAYELRYQVYCLEKGFLPPSDYPDKRESDSFDSGAVLHICVTDNEESLLAYLRLICPDEGRVLPVSQLFDIAMKPEAVEVSRFIVNSNLNHRDKLRAIEHLCSGLYMACMQNNIKECWAVMEPPLIGLLAKMGPVFANDGRTTQYMGTLNYAAKLDLLTVWDSVLQYRPSLIAILQEQGYPTSNPQLQKLA